MPDRPELVDPPPQYTKYRAGPRFLRRSSRGGSPLDELRGRAPGKGPRRRLTAGRVVRWAVLAVLAWVALSALVFLVSAQIQQGKIGDEVGAQLGGAGFPLTSPNTILVLGSDRRTDDTAEPGSSTTGPSRSDSILLIRTGGGTSARLSIPRDTVVDIPGHGRNKVNAAYAIGGAALAVTTIEQFLGVEVNHLVEVDFANFPKLIDAMGGVDYTGGCVVSKINGGFANGGYTLRLPRGTSHLDGEQALALARTRRNACNPNESDLSRARRQQKIFAAMKDRLTSPAAFARLPFIAWRAPQAIRSDMSGPTLLGLFGATATGGTPPTRVLKPSGGITLPGGGAGLVVSEDVRQREVGRFLRG